METTLNTVNSNGEKTGSYQINSTWIEEIKGEQAVHDAVIAFLAKTRAGTAATKTKAMVRGGGAKPWKQKGTGRARAGSIRSPLWRGGGVTFGPQPRNYEKGMNRGTRRLALKRTFTERVKEGSVILVDAIELAEAKTRCMNAFLKAIDAGSDVLIVVDEITPAVSLAAANLPRVEVMKASTVNPYWMLLFKKIVFTKTALEAFGKRLAVQEVEA